MIGWFAPWLLLLSAACVGDDGTGYVEARFDPPECPIGEVNDSLKLLRYEAGWLATERYLGVIYLQVFDHQVRLEETDGLSIRVSLQDLVDQKLLVLDPVRDRLVRADEGQPLRLPVGLGQDEHNASLSLYLTCPDQPSFPAIGTLVFNDLVLAAEGEDTGVDEHVQGSFTATLTRSLEGPVVGQLRSEFDFLPPRQPLATFK